MSGFGLLTLGTQSLQANQTALNVTGQNISNVNTEGYTRQKPVFQSREFYAGVEVSEVDRLADQFLNRQIWADSATHSSYDAFEDYANELDNLMASDVTSVSKAMDDYFGSLQQAVDDPVSLPNRELFIANSEALVKRFNDLDANIRRQQDTINGRLESSVSAINTIASHIAELNDDIRIAQAAGNVASEMLDQRDQQLEALSEYVSFTTIEQPTGEMSVFVGNGEPLVVGLSANTMTTLISPADTSQLNVGIVIGSNVGDITNQLSGGKIGGALDYRETILNNTLDELGRMAIVFAETMNEQHQKGMDLDGSAGGLMFSDINDSSLTGSRVLSERDNARPATGSVVINDVTQLVATEYELSFNTTDSFTLVRGSDDLRLTDESMTEVAAASDVDEDGEFFFDSSNGILRLRVDGVTLSLESSEIFAPGDKFLVRPVRTGASDIESVLNNARQLALATPLAVSENVANSGTGEVSVTVTEIEYDVLSQVPNTAVPPSVAGLEVNADEANAGTVAIQVTDPARINNLTYPLSLTHNAGDYAIVDGDGNPLGGSPFTPALGVIDLSTEFGLSITVGGVPLDGEVSQIEYDSTTINDTSLTPPVAVSFLSQLQGVAYGGNDLVTAPTGVSATDVSTGMTFSSVAINNAEVAGSVDYPLTLTYNNGTGVFDIDDVNGNTLAFTGTFTGTNMTIPEIGVSIDVAAVPVFAGGEQFTLAPTTQNEVQYSPVFSAVTGQPSAAGAIDARVTDTSTVNSANYPLTVTYSSSGPDVYTVTDSTGATLLSAAPGSLDIPGIGLSLDVTGVPVVGDTFTIQPDAHTNGNANAAVTNVRITDDRLVGDVTYPLTVIYDAASTEFSVSDSASPAMTLFRGPWDNGTLDLTQTYGFAIDFDAAEVPADGDIFTIQHDPDSTEAAYVVLTDADGERALKENTPGQPITLSGYEITVKNQPVVGDRFTVNLNIDGVSDNRNALLMSDLQFTRTIEGASYQDKYGQTVEQVGTQAAVAQVNAQAGKTVLDANKQMRDSISGVNLDEEAAKLVQYQQAYQASAQLIRASQTIFDALLQSV